MSACQKAKDAREALERSISFTKELNEQRHAEASMRAQCAKQAVAEKAVKMASPRKDLDALRDEEEQKRDMLRRAMQQRLAAAGLRVEEHRSQIVRKAADMASPPRVRSPRRTTADATEASRVSKLDFQATGKPRNECDPYRSPMATEFGSLEPQLDILDNLHVIKSEKFKPELLQHESTTTGTNEHCDTQETLRENYKTVGDHGSATSSGLSNPQATCLGSAIPKNSANDVGGGGCVLN